MSDKVEAGYDQMAEQYLKAKNPNNEWLQASIEELCHDLPDRATALDLGCGAGVPVTQWLARRFDTIGVDVSERQLELASQYVPTAHLIKSDMLTLAFPSSSFDVVVALYSIIHVPREEQPALVARIYNWLKPGGRFLATWAINAWEGEEEDWEGWGAPMWWSTFDADANLTMLRAAGFQIQSAERRTDNGETWLWIAAHR